MWLTSWDCRASDMNIARGVPRPVSVPLPFDDLDVVDDELYAKAWVSGDHFVEVVYPATVWDYNPSATSRKKPEGKFVLPIEWLGGFRHEVDPEVAMRDAHEAWLRRAGLANF